MTEWVTKDFATYVEVKPVADTRLHYAGDECWCQPTVTRDKNARPIITHNHKANLDQLKSKNGKGV